MQRLAQRWRHWGHKVLSIEGALEELRKVTNRGMVNWQSRSKLSVENLIEDVDEDQGSSMDGKGMKGLLLTLN